MLDLVCEAIGPGMVLCVDPDTGRPYLLVDRQAIRTSLRDSKRRFRHTLSQWADVPLARLSRVESTWKDQVSPTSIAILVPGFQSTGQPAQEFASALFQELAIPTLIFEYGNDSPIRESAQSLAMCLDHLSQRYRGIPLKLVGHSMGGLVIRAAIEPEGTPDWLIQDVVCICTPHRGSAVAQYSAPLEALEHTFRWVSSRRGNGGSDHGPLLHMVLDGLGESGQDLRPGSELLQSLASCSRRPGTRYHCVVGNRGPLNGIHRILLQTLWSEVRNQGGEVPGLDPHIDRWLSFDELHQGLGDGAVTVRSARLEGVEDLVVLPIHHLQWSQTQTRGGGQVLHEVARMLKP